MLLCVSSGVGKETLTLIARSSWISENEVERCSKMPPSDTPGIDQSIKMLDGVDQPDPVFLILSRFVF